MNPPELNLRWSAITLLLAALVWVAQMAGTAGQPLSTGELAGKAEPGVTHVVESNWASPVRGELSEQPSDPESTARATDPLVAQLPQSGLVIAFQVVGPVARRSVTPGIRAPPRFSFFV